MTSRQRFAKGCSILAACAALLALISAGRAESTVPETPAAIQAHFVDSGQLLGTAASYDVALGDVDGDGDADALVANSNAAHALWINQGGAQGGQPGFFQDSGQALGTGSGLSVELGDLDGDGDLDAFVVTDIFPNGNQVYINQGGDQGGSAGTFQSSGQAFGYANGTSLALGFLDADANFDAFITHKLAGPDRVWEGAGDGTFIDSMQSLETQQTFAVDLGDVDGDGDLDAFLAVFASSKVWLNQGGTGNFVDSGQELLSGRTEGVALADVDGDNDLDAYVGTNGPTDKLWINQGGAQGGTPGTFQDSGQALSSGATSSDVAFGDVDLDGDVDAILAKLSGGDNELWINQGGAQGGTAGVFQDSGDQLGSGFSRAVEMADLNGDGSLDLFFANSDGPNQVWFNQDQTADNTANLRIEMGGDQLIKEECCQSAAPLLFQPRQTPIQVTNLGPGPATNVTVKFERHYNTNAMTYSCDWSGSCAAVNLGTLQKDQSMTVHIRFSGGFHSIRSFQNYQDETIWTSGGVYATVSSDESDPDTRNNFDRSFIYLFDCDRGITCALNKIFCENLPSQQFEILGGQFPDLVWTAADFVPNIVTYYHIRDLVLGVSLPGLHYISLYYKNDAAIQTLLDDDPALQEDALNTLELWEPNLQALLKGRGASAVITAEQVTAVDNFLSDLSAAADPDLQDVIAEERANLAPLESFVGMSMDDARGLVVGYASSYAPVVSGGG